MACLVSAFVSNVSADASSQLISCCSLAFFFFSSSIWSDIAFLFLSDCSASAFYSSRYKLYFCHYLQPGVTLYRLHQPGQCYPHTSHDRIYFSWQQKSQPAGELQLACLLKNLFLQLLDRVKEQATMQHSENIPQLAVHVLASHVLMHQDIHSGLDLVKIHKMVSFLVNHGSCILRVLE